MSRNLNIGDLVLFVGHFYIATVCDVGHKILLDQIHIIAPWAETQNWDLETPLVDQLLLLLWQKKAKSSGMQHCMSSRMATSLRASATQKFRISSPGSLLLMCAGSLFKVSANESGSCSFSNSRSFFAIRHLITSTNVLKSYTMACRKVSIFFFGINWSFMEFLLQTLLDQFQSLLQETPFFFPAFMNTAHLLSTFVFLAWFFQKWLLPFTVLDNTLDNHANDSHETGRLCLFPGKNHPLDVLQPSFPHHGHTYCVGYAHSSVWPHVPSSWPLFPHMPACHKMLFQTVSSNWIFSPWQTTLVSALVQTSASAADCRL